MRQGWALPVVAFVLTFGCCEGGAEDGKALKLFNTHFTWCVQFPISRVAFEPGAKYRLRLRVRVDSRRDGMAFSSGIHCTSGGASPGSVRFTTCRGFCAASPEQRARCAPSEA